MNVLLRERLGESLAQQNVLVETVASEVSGVSEDRLRSWQAKAD